MKSYEVPIEETPFGGEKTYHLVAALRRILADRERELLELKGPCSTCRLHYAHSGPCDTREARD